MLWYMLVSKAIGRYLNARCPLHRLFFGRGLVLDGPGVDRKRQANCF